MSYGIQYLCHLVQTKNDINRKRRRFYSIANPGLKYNPVTREWMPSLPLHKAYTRVEASQGYMDAQAQMRAMTPHMRKVRSELGARFIWSDHGAINAIEYEGRRYGEKEIGSMANEYKADEIILDLPSWKEAK